MTQTPQRCDTIREALNSLAGSENALTRSAIRIAINELDLADLADDPTPHFEQLGKIIDAVLNPEDNSE